MYPSLTLLVCMEQSLVSVVAQVCDMTSSVPLLFPEGQLYGYGNSGLYRTDGLVLNLQCTYKGTGTGTMTIFHQTNTLLAVQNFSITNNISTLTHMLPGLIAANEYWCQCKVGNLTTKSNSTIKIPNLQPCDKKQCGENEGDVCYQDSWSCEKESLSSIHWNEGAPYDRLLELFEPTLFTFQNQSLWESFKQLYQTHTRDQGMCHMSDVNGVAEKIKLVKLCQYHKTLIKHPEINKKPLFEMALSLKCKNPDFDAMPMTVNGNVLYIGTVHYIMDTEHLVLKVANGSSKVDFGHIKCTMYTWERGTDPTQGTSKFMDPVWQHKDNSSTNKTWHIRAEDLSQETDTLNMIGCTYKRGNNTYTTASNPYPHLLQSQHVEFFVRWHATVEPIYNKDDYLVGCSTETDGQAVMTERVEKHPTHCFCVFPPIFNCNPIRTITNIAAALMMSCKRPEPFSIKEDTDESITWIIIAIIICLVLMNSYAFGSFIIKTKKLRAKAEIASAKESDSEKHQSSLTHNTYFYDTSTEIRDKFLIAGSMDTTESLHTAEQTRSYDAHNEMRSTTSQISPITFEHDSQLKSKSYTIPHVEETQ